MQGSELPPGLLGCSQFDMYGPLFFPLPSILNSISSLDPVKGSSSPTVVPSMYRRPMMRMATSIIIARLFRLPFLFQVFPPPQRQGFLGSSKVVNETIIIPQPPHSIRPDPLT